MSEPKNFRLHLPEEYFWATWYPDLPENQAEINNFILSDGFDFGDRVEFDEDKNVTRLVMRRDQVKKEQTQNE